MGEYVRDARNKILRKERYIRPKTDTPSFVNPIDPVENNVDMNCFDLSQFDLSDFNEQSTFAQIINLLERTDAETLKQCLLILLRSVENDQFLANFVNHIQQNIK